MRGSLRIQEPFNFKKMCFTKSEIEAYTLKAPNQKFLTKAQSLFLHSLKQFCHLQKRSISR